MAFLVLGAVTLRRAPVTEAIEVVAGSLLAAGLVLLGVGLQAAMG